MTFEPFKINNSKFAVMELVSINQVKPNPSGNLTPSQADINVTNNIVECLKLFNTTVLDHIIMTKNSYYSMKNGGDF